MKESYILYCVTILAIWTLKISQKNAYNGLQVIKEFNYNHIIPSIVIPIINLIYSVSTNSFLGILGDNLKFTKIMDIMYDNLTINQNIYFGTIIYSFEILSSFFITLSYFIIITQFISIISNIQNGSEITSDDIKITVTIIITLIILLFLHGYLSTYILNNYKDKPKELIKNFINIIIYFSVFISIIISLKYLKKFKTKNITDNNIFFNYLNVSDKNDLLFNLTQKLKNKLVPLKNIVNNHILMSLLNQGVFAIFFKIANTRSYNIKNKFIKKQIFTNIILLMSIVYKIKY